MAAREGAIPRALETGPGADGSPAFSPDGRVDRLRRGRRPEGLLVRGDSCCRGPGLGRRAARAHGLARPQRREPAFRPRRPLGSVPPGGPGQPAPRAGRAGWRRGRARRHRRARRRGLRRGSRRRDRRARELGPPAERGLASSRTARSRAADPRERRAARGHRARAGRAVPGDEPRRHCRGRLPDTTPAPHARAGGCRRSCASTAGPRTSTRRRSTSSGSCSPRTATPSSPRTHAARRVAAPPSAARSGPTGETRTTRT